MNHVGIYFVVNKKLLYEFIDIEGAEKFGDFKVYSGSYYNVWTKKYERIYKKSFDYFPRGRVVYNFISDEFILYADKCIIDEIINNIKLIFGLTETDVVIRETDSHYVCHECNEDYIDEYYL